MKFRLTILLGFLCLSFSAFSQINLEHKYLNSITPYKLSTGNTIYTIFNETTNQITIYNSNHSLLKTISVPQIPNYKVASVCCISDKTFETNASTIEYGAEYQLINTSTYVNDIKIYNESGSVILAEDSIDNFGNNTGSSRPTFVNTNNGTKLHLMKRLPGTGTYYYHTLVYSLPGQYFPLAVKEFGTETDALPYPNPTSNEITIPHNFKPGEQGHINIYLSTGKLMKTYTVDGTFNNLLLDTKQLNAGNYFYQIEANGKVTGSNKFVVVK